MAVPPLTPPLSYHRLPVQAGGTRRSFTQPPRALSFHEQAGLDPSDSAAEVLYSHASARVLSFIPASEVCRASSSPASHDYDYPVDTIGTLSWKSASESVLASGPIVIEKVQGSTNFLKSGSHTLHALLRNSQCWCVDGEGTLVIRVGKLKYHRLELPYLTDEDKKKAQELKELLARILRFEATPCPFKRGFHVDLPESATTPRKRGPWRRKTGSFLSTPATPLSPVFSKKRSSQSHGIEAESPVVESYFPLLANDSLPGEATNEATRSIGSVCSANQIETLHECRKRGLHHDKENTPNAVARTFSDPGSVERHPPRDLALLQNAKKSHALRSPVELSEYTEVHNNINDSVGSSVDDIILPRNERDPRTTRHIATTHDKSKGEVEEAIEIRSADHAQSDDELSLILSPGDQHDPRMHSGSNSELQDTSITSTLNDKMEHHDHRDKSGTRTLSSLNNDIVPSSKDSRTYAHRDPSSLPVGPPAATGVYQKSSRHGHSGRSLSSSPRASRSPTPSLSPNSLDRMEHNSVSAMPEASEVGEGIANLTAQRTVHATQPESFLAADNTSLASSSHSFKSLRSTSSAGENSSTGNFEPSLPGAFDATPLPALLYNQNASETNVNCNEVTGLGLDIAGRGRRSRPIDSRKASPIPMQQSSYATSSLASISWRRQLAGPVLRYVALEKPIDAVVMVAHVLARIIAGATYKDLVSGELFRKPGERRLSDSIRSTTNEWNDSLRRPDIPEFKNFRSSQMEQTVPTRRLSPQPGDESDQTLDVD